MEKSVRIGLLFPILDAFLWLNVHNESVTIPIGHVFPRERTLAAMADHLFYRCRLPKRFDAADDWNFNRCRIEVNGQLGSRFRPQREISIA